MLWFEFGGSKIGRIFLDGQAEETPKWRLIGKYKYDFACHFTLVYVNDKIGYYLIGGTGNNCLSYCNKNITVKQPMMAEKSFFSAFYLNGQIFTFGGYDNYDKLQLKSCEIYDLNKNEWMNNEGIQLNEARSQSSACIFDNKVAFVFGGYNKEVGTLNTIEKYQINENKISLLEIKLPTPIRRFGSIKISTTKILLIGGVQRLSKESDAVFCFDLENEYSIEKLDKIDKAGVVEYPIVVDPVGNLHLFIENASGTSPPAHIMYSFLEYS
jgi:hypothetical protein